MPASTPHPAADRGSATITVTTDNGIKATTAITVVAARLESPHIVRVFDYDVTDAGIPYLVMELLEGQPLSHLVASGAPLYVVKLDAAHRRVVVGPREALRMDRISLRDVIMSQDMIHDGRPVCQETECLPLTYAALAQSDAHTQTVERFT